MTETLHTDPAMAAHSKAFEDAYQAARVARRTLYSRAVAYAAALVRTQLPEAATLTIDAEERELHEVLDAKGNTLWHAPSSAGHGLTDDITDEANCLLSDTIPFGSLAGAARWKAAPQGLPFRTIALPEALAPRAADHSALAVRQSASQGRAMVRASEESAAVVHATIGPGLDSFAIDGVSHERETRDRIRAAIVNGGYAWPTGRVTVTVESVAARPLGSMHDLAIACAILGAAGHYGPNALTNVAFIGELGLDGRVRPVPDVNEAARSAIASGCTIAFIADDDLSTIDVAGIGIYYVENLHQAVAALQGFDRANS
ncbi:magnesium chelatase domain-containing protein [Streptomyces sp. NPDC097727]|uniref:magnesium chelatase domain-containing protein n=1 Tax=Streptomyces sp. NPDC097727 TaxID=3366092 RepID=UPI0037FB9F1F